MIVSSWKSQSWAATRQKVQVPPTSRDFSTTPSARPSRSLERDFTSPIQLIMRTWNGEGIHGYQPRGRSISMIFPSASRSMSTMLRGSWMTPKTAMKKAGDSPASLISAARFSGSSSACRWQSSRKASTFLRHASHAAGSSGTSRMAGGKPLMICVMGGHLDNLILRFRFLGFTTTDEGQQGVAALARNRLGVVLLRPEWLGVVLRTHEWQVPGAVEDRLGGVHAKFCLLVRVVDHAPQVGRALAGGSDDGLAHLVVDARGHLAEGLGGLLGPVVALRPRADGTAGHLPLGRLPLVVGAGVVQPLGGLGSVVVAEEGPDLVGEGTDLLRVGLQLLAVQAT